MGEITDSFLENPSPVLAENVLEVFRRLRHNPPKPIRRAFFPLDRGEVKALTKGSPALLRPMLKTDQGPGGTFLGFRIVEKKDFQEPSSFTITTESGMAVPEDYFTQQVIEMGMPDKVVEAMREVQGLFQIGEEYDCKLALERLSIACDEYGIEFQRQAGVGRLPFFFIRPAETQKGIIDIPSPLASRVAIRIGQETERIEAMAQVANLLVRENQGIEEAISAARSLSREELSRFEPSEQKIIYFQPDVIVRKDGSFEIEKVNLPDVGLFLTQIQTENPIFNRIGFVVEQLTKDVIIEIVKEVHASKAKEMVIMTREGVLANREDTLEILEIAALSSFLREYGIRTEIKSLSKVNELPNQVFVLLMNVSSEEQGFRDLLERSAKGRLTCYPDPFVLLFEQEVTTLPKRVLSKEEIETLGAIIDPSYHDPKDSLRQILALDGYLRRLGFPEENIFYIYGVGKRKVPAAAFRYDPRGFSLALKAFNEVDEIVLEGLRFLSEDAVIIGSDGPRLAAFRFMGVKRGE